MTSSARSLRGIRRGPAFTGGDTSDTAIAGVRAGLPFAVFDEMAATYDLAPDLVGRTIGVPARTLARRRAEGRFRPDESDRLARLARVAARAKDTFEDSTKAGHWLVTAVVALGDRTPISLLDTDLGAVRVEQVLGRIDHGIVS